MSLAFKDIFFAVKNCIIILLLLVVSCTGTAQENDGKIKFLMKAETRNSFVQTHHALYFGVRAGVELRIPVRLGIGYYWLLTGIDSQLYDPAANPQAGATARPRMRYAILFADVSFYKEDHWELSVPVQLGIGETFYRSPGLNRFANGLILPLETGISVSYLFTPWAGFGVGLGYRFMLKSNRGVKENFNSPYYQVRLNILLTEVFRGVRKKKGSSDRQ